MSRFEDRHVIRRVSRDMEKLQAERPDLQLITVCERHVWLRRRIRVRSDACAGRLFYRRITVDVILVSMSVEDVRNRQSLVAAALDKGLGRVRRVDDDPFSGSAIAKQVAEVPVAARANLFENQPH